MSSHSQQSQSNASPSPSQSPSPQSLSWDRISNYFSVPLSDAANNLGVCVSVLKKICRENGLDRWPYRKYLAGKSIEDIKRYASREKFRELARLAKVGRQSGLLHQASESAKLQVAASTHKLQQGSKDVPSGKQQIVLTPGLTRGTMGLDEFKYGFPSDGLSATTNKWWVNNCPDSCEGTDGDGTETDEDDKHPYEKSAVCSASSVLNKEKPDYGKMEIDIHAQGTQLLTAVRKRTVEEGQEALELGVYKIYGVKKLGRKDRALLLRIFGSSLPKEWI